MNQPITANSAYRGKKIIPDDIRKGKGIRINPASGGPEMELVDYLKSDSKSLFIFGSYAADFNAIEYAQRLRHYLPVLEKECGVQESFNMPAEILR